MRMLVEALDGQVLLADAGMEESLRAVAVDVTRDLFGAEGCLAVLNLTRARLVRSLHEGQLRAGADLVRTNTIQASPLELRRFGLEDDAFAINYAGAQLAAAAVDAVPGGDRRRFVLGVVRDLGWNATSQEIEDATAAQVSALIAGGVDGVAVQIAAGTCRGPAFLSGARQARSEAKSAASIFLVQTGDENSEMLRRLADSVIRYSEVSVGDGAEITDAIRRANLIGGRKAEDTASLDQLLRAMSEEAARPPRLEAHHPLDISSPPGHFAPDKQLSARRHREPSIAGTVIYYASGWAHRR